MGWWEANRTWVGCLGHWQKCVTLPLLEDTDNLWEVVGSLVVTVALGFQRPCWRWAAPGQLHRPACSRVPSSWPHLPLKASVPVVIVFILLQPVEQACTYYPSLIWHGGDCAWSCCWAPVFQCPRKAGRAAVTLKKTGEGYSSGRTSTWNKCPAFSSFPSCWLVFGKQFLPWRSVLTTSVKKCCRLFRNHVGFNFRNMPLSVLQSWATCLNSSCLVD